MMEAKRAPNGALNLTMAPCFWNLLEGETPPSPPFRYGPENRTIEKHIHKLSFSNNHSISNLYFQP